MTWIPHPDPKLLRLVAASWLASAVGVWAALASRDAPAGLADGLFALGAALVMGASVLFRLFWIRHHRREQGA